MYLEHFRLKEFPFLSSPDVRFLYLSESVNTTLQKCLYMVTHRIGPVFAAGPIGSGKTTLSHRLQQQLEQAPATYLAAYIIIPPQLSVNAVLRMMMDEFAIKTDRSYHGSLKNFADWLMTQNSAGIKPVIILDEAQNLTPTHLKLLHFLLNYETSREKLLQMLLFGQTQLTTKIERFPELKSRMYPAALSAFDRADTEALIQFRWQVAGGKALPFSTEALDEIFRVSLGLPREIVKLCDLALLHAFSTKRTKVQGADVQAAAGELHLEKEQEKE
jgi:general secretion pathway protein A